jgi:6-phosphogluconolactonase (cycloisomerase 2 family)
MTASDDRSRPPVSRRTVLGGAAAVALAPALGMGPARAAGAPRFAYVGSFTTPQRGARGDGINVYRVDPASGGWTHVQLVSDLINPSFLTIDRAQRHLYSVHADLTEVSAFAIDPASGRLSFLNRQSMDGKNPVHLAIDPSGKFLVTANYTGGTVAVLSIQPDGSLGGHTDSVALKGKAGPHKTDQTSSHPHDAPFDPTGRFIVVPDKGLDRVFVFKLDTGTGKLIENDPPSVATRSGAGPRHVAFHPSLPIAYVVNELDSTVVTYRWDHDRGTLAPLQDVSALPTSFTGNSTCAEIAVAPSGRFVYASNRGHDSIAIFAVDKTGLLTPIAWEPTGGSTPRHFALDPTARFLYAENEQGDTVVTFRVDPASGKLALTGRIIKVASPVCVVFTTA